MMYLLKLIIPHIATNSYYKITKFDKKIKPCKAFGVLGCQTSGNMPIHTPLPEPLFFVLK